jgi:hypothetical protein
MSSDRPQCCDCGHICCMYTSSTKCTRKIKLDDSNKGVDGCEKCKYMIGKIRHIPSGANSNHSENQREPPSVMENPGRSADDLGYISNTTHTCFRNNTSNISNLHESRLQRNMNSSRSSKSSTPNKRKIHTPRFGSKSKSVRNVQCSSSGSNKEEDLNKEVSVDKDVNINTMVNFDGTNINKNEVIFTSNSLTKNSSTIPCDSISDQYGRKLWSWSLSPPPVNGIMTNYDGINANAGIDIEGKYIWSVNFYTLSHKLNPLQQSDETLDEIQEKPGTIRLNLSLCIHKGANIVNVELIKEYTIIHRGDDPNYHYVELGELDIKSGIALILLRRVADDDIDDVYPNNIYIIGLTGTER